jgi:hypothetical protein
MNMKAVRTSNIIINHNQTVQQPKNKLTSVTNHRESQKSVHVLYVSLLLNNEASVE